MFKIPFSILPMGTLKKVFRLFLGVGEPMTSMFPFLKMDLKRAEIDLEAREYISMCICSNVFFFLFFSIIIMIGLFLFPAGKIKSLPFVLTGLVFLIFFMFLQQVNYPKLLTNRRIKNLEKNLLPVLQNIMIQLNSGVSLFDVFVNISRGEYGEISKEFAKAVKEINAGKPQVEALEEMAVVNPSLFFRRALWQLVNGLKAGSDVSVVMGEVINALSEEQVIQIQKYGGQLSPLAMFYMLIAVIIPALGMTFLIVISSFVSVSGFATKLIFWGLYGMVFFFQIMFLGLIRTRRPSLLED